MRAVQRTGRAALVSHQNPKPEFGMVDLYPTRVLNFRSIDSFSAARWRCSHGCALERTLAKILNEKYRSAQ
jgi:hypothetical protein